MSVQFSAKKPHKYKAVPTWVDNIRFDSKREALRYTELRTLQSAGKIKDLKLQVIFQFFSAGIEIDRWRIDFTYVENGKKIADDPTGFLTGKKMKHMKYFEQQYPDWELRLT
jgi:hypothetical protein